MIYFARHGQTDYNLAGLWMGQTDVALNATGLAQAYALAQALANLDISLCVTSPLQRAKTSAKIVTQRLGLGEAVIEPGMAERRLGKLEGQPKTELIRQNLDLYQDVEDAFSFYARIASAMDGIIALSCQHNTKRNVLIVSHSGVFRALKTEFGYHTTPNQDNLPNGSYIGLIPPGSR